MAKFFLKKRRLNFVKGLLTLEGEMVEEQESQDLLGKLIEENQSDDTMDWIMVTIAGEEGDELGHLS